MPKHQLLANVLDVLKTHVKWQRLFMEYNELFQFCCKAKTVDTSMDTDAVVAIPQMKTKSESCASKPESNSVPI